MKHIILSLALLVGIVVSGNSQAGYITKYFGESTGSAVNDTLTNAATLTFTLNDILKHKCSIHVGITSDSLSGSTAGTINYQVAFVEAPTADQWVTVATDVIDGVSDTDDWEDTDFNAVRFRMQIVGAGTQSTEVTPTLTVKRNN